MIDDKNLVWDVFGDEGEDVVSGKVILMNVFDVIYWNVILSMYGCVVLSNSDVIVSEIDVSVM